MEGARGVGVACVRGPLELLRHRPRVARLLQPDERGEVRREAGLGLGLLHALVSSPDDWDRYEGYQWQAAERYAKRNPNDPDVPELLARMRKARDHYLRWGREEIGWAAYLFLREPYPIATATENA